MIQFTPKTGQVFIRQFDEGVFTRLGAYVDTKTIESIGKPRRGYWLDMVTSAPTTVPVFFTQAEQISEQKVYPSIVISRDDPVPAMQRWQSVQQLAYFAGVSGTEETAKVFGKTVSGFSQIESQPQAIPYDMPYTITSYARYEHESLPMLKWILSHFQPYSRIPVVDSLAATRYYSVFADSGFQNLSEIADVADRSKVYALSIRVEGELDLNDPIVRSTVATFVTNFEVL